MLRSLNQRSTGRHTFSKVVKYLGYTTYINVYHLASSYGEDPLVLWIRWYPQLIRVRTGASCAACVQHIAGQLP